MPYSLKNVFTPGGQPTVTYVSREHLELENKIRRAINQGYSINVVTGATKSGKTVLCTKVLEEKQKYIKVEGGQIRNEDDFWRHAAYFLNLADTTTKIQHSSESNSVAGGAKGGFPGLASASADWQETDSSGQSTSVGYSQVDLLGVTRRLIEDEIAVLVDDFHYIPTETQRHIIQALKEPIRQGLCVFLLAVPHRAFDAVTVEDEMEGRFRHIEIPRWSLEDLILIPDLGFSALNVKCSQDAVRKICQESFGNPLIVQEICSELCANSDVWETCTRVTQLNEESLPKTFENVARSKGFPKYRQLREGPQARKPRKLMELADGSKEDIYSVLMRALTELGPKPRNSYDEIRAQLRQSLNEGEVPQKHEITRALSHMSKIADENIEGEAPLEWLSDQDALVVIDPFLLFYMKWVTDKRAPGSA